MEREPTSAETTRQLLVVTFIEQWLRVEQLALAGPPSRKMKMADFARGLKCGDFTTSDWRVSSRRRKQSVASKSDESATAPRPLAELVRKLRRLNNEGS